MMSAQDARQGLQVFLGGGPGGDKAAHGMVAVGGTPMGELHLLLQLAHLAVGNHHKLLIGGRIQEEGVAVVSKQLLQLHGHTNGMGGDVEIEIIRKQRIKLHTHPPADLWPVALHDA